MGRLLRYASLLLAGALVAGSMAAAPAAADGSRKAGPFEISAHERRIGDSGRRSPRCWWSPARACT